MNKHSLANALGGFLVVITFASTLFLYFNNSNLQQTAKSQSINQTAASALVPGGFIFGVTASETISTSFLKGLNLTSARIWKEVRDWDNPPSSSEFSNMRKLQAEGIKTVVVFTPTENKKVNGSCVKSVPIPNYNQVYNYFKKAAAAANGAVDYWEIGNEPNLCTYWSGSMKQYVDILQKGAWDALHPLGEITISGSVSWDANALKTPGLTSYADIIGFHPYGGSGENSAEQQISRIKQARANIGSTKPMFLTEWNVHYRKDKTDFSFDKAKWAAQLPIAYNGIKNYVQGIWYYPSKYRPDSMAGPAGLRTADGSSANEPFYSTYKKITGGAGGGVSGDGGNSGGSTGGTGGNSGGGGNPTDDGGSGGDIDIGDYTGGGIGDDNSNATGTDRTDINQGEYTGPLMMCIDASDPSSCVDVIATENCKDSTNVTQCKEDFIDQYTGTPSGSSGGYTQPPTPTITPHGAGGLIPCNGASDCDFNAFIRLVKNVINAFFIIAAPLAAVSFAYAGWLYLTSAGDVAKTTRAKYVFKMVLIGFVILLSAWLIVTTLLTALLSPEVLNKLPIKFGS